MGKRNTLKRWDLEGEGGKSKKNGTLNKGPFKRRQQFSQLPS
jgi:hypothetical protein